MPRGRPRIEVTSWDYKSPMSAKTVLGSEYDPSKQYRFVREDKVDHMKAAYGYEPSKTGKKFKELVLMETSMDKHLENRAEVKRRIDLRQKQLGAKDQARRVVSPSNVDFND